MKKILLLSLFICLVLTVFATNPRVYMQKVTLGDGTMPGNPTDTNPIPNYIYAVYNSADPATIIATNTASNPANICLKRIGNGTTIPYYVAAYVNQSLFPTVWAVGSILTCTVTYIPTGQTASWTKVVPSGSTITDLDPPVIVPPFSINHWTYNLTVNGPAGTVVTGPGTYTGTLPTMFTCGPNTTDINDLLGSWSVPGTDWVVNPIVVDATGWTGAKEDHVFNKTIEFVPAGPTYTLNVNAMGPATPIYKNGNPTGQTTNYSFVGAAAAELVGTYTLEPLPAGWHWEPASFEVVATDFVSSKSGVQIWGTMSNGAKVAYAHTIQFVQTENVINPVTPPAGVVVAGMGFGDVDPALIGPDTGMPWVGYTITATGIWDVTIPKPAAYAGDWYCWLQVGGVLMAGPNPIPAATLFYTFNNVDFGAKGIVHAIANDNMTLPVELSSFTGTMTAEYFVQLNWTSQSETSLLGYRVLRSETADVSNAVSITPTLVTATNTSTTQNYSITDTEVENNTTYSYWLESVNMDGTSEFHGPVNVLVEHEVPPVLPEVTSMRNAYPNPFAQNSSTNLEVSVKAGETGTVTIYNILGQVVKTYTVREGLNNLNWNGKDSKGNTCGSGIYFYRLSTPSMNQTKKMVIVK